MKKRELQKNSKPEPIKMEIAKNIYNTDYLKLNLKDLNSIDWEKAIDIFEKRVFERFIEPIDILIDTEKNIPPINRKYGFLILATDCMILENIQCFYEGKENSNRKSEKVFIRFLTQRDNFKNHFDKKTSSIFFKDFRCGILHQLETYNNSKIWSIGKMVSIVENNLIINRTEFHKNIKKEFYIYIQKLRTENNLRENFKTKMNFICKR